MHGCGGDVGIPSKDEVVESATLVTKVAPAGRGAAVVLPAPALRDLIGSAFRSVGISNVLLYLAVPGDARTKIAAEASHLCVTLEWGVVSRADPNCNIFSCTVHMHRSHLIICSPYCPISHLVGHVGRGGP